VRLQRQRTTNEHRASIDGADDRALLRAAQENPADFDQLFDRFGDPLLNYCFYRLGTWEDAEDACQQIFAKAFASINRFADSDESPESSVRAWLFTIAHHHVANFHRSRVRHPESTFETLVEFPDPSPTPEELAIAADNQGRVLSLISQLSVDQRQVVELRLAGLTDNEIASTLGRKSGAIRAIQFRAISKLRDLVGASFQGKEIGHV
jgi:RNA polymerase sigma-70 factor, ECF subfamily